MLDNTSDFTAKGLSSVEANELLKKDGYNEIASAKKKSAFRIAFDVIKEPMFILLLAGGAIYIVLGELKDALILISFVFLMIGITFYQEGKTERALEALKDLSSPRALVIRDGQEKKNPWQGSRQGRYNDSI